MEHEFKITKEIEACGKVWFHVTVNGDHQASRKTYEEAKEMLEKCKNNVRRWKAEKYKEVVYLERWDG